MNISESNIFNNNSQKILGLDFLRTLAIAGVTLFHMFPTIIPGGYFGVSIFFVLTGYLIAFTSEKARINGDFSLLGYYWKRFKRIYPSLVVVILSTIGIYHFLAPDVIEGVRKEIISILLGYNNWWQISQHADYFSKFTSQSPFTHLWFMGIELQYYFCWPILFLVYDLFVEFNLRKIGIGLIAVLGIVFAAFMPIMYYNNADITRLYYGTDTRVYALFFGAVLGIIHAGKKNNSINMIDSDAATILEYLIFVICLGMTVVSYKFLDGQNPLVYQGGMLAMTLMFCLMLILIADNKLELGRWLEQPIFSWIGKNSYGIFLWQYPVIFLFNYKGWTDLFIAPLIELSAIILLTMWSTSVSNALTHRKLPCIGRRLVMTQGMLFLTITFVGTIFMGFGCRSLAMSVNNKPDLSELRTRIEANKEKVEQQNQKIKAELDAQNQQNISPSSEMNQTAQTDPNKRRKKVDLNGVVFIGDSIMLDSADELQRLLPNCYVNAEVSRHIFGGIKAARFFESQGMLGNTVVVALGTNETVDFFDRYKGYMTELLDYLGPGRQVFLVNIYDGSGNFEWQKLVNNYIKSLSVERSNVSVIDWNSRIAPHPEWLWGDHVHPNEQGCKEYAKLMYENLTNNY